MRPALILLFALTLLLCTRASAQIGLHPPQVDWQQLRTDEGNVIYPKGYEARAQRIANILATMRAEYRETVGEKYYKFDLILQTPNTTINGYVGLAPFRSEFFLTPPQQPNLLSNADWADLLAIHEFRHVQQTSNERRGLTKLNSYLIGQLGWAGPAALATPNWYSEGDAVIMESALTRSGRGRTPAFSATFRSLLDEGIQYNYARSRNNSLRRNIPDHYRYGYNTITYAREKYGYDVWKRPLHVGAAWAGLLYPFSNALKKETGLGTRKMYRAALEDLNQRQEADLAARGPIVAGETISRQRRAVTNYTYPTTDGGGNLLALRAGFTHIPQIVKLDPATGREQVVVTIGLQRENYFHARGDQIVWMENRNDPRYTNEGFSDVFIYNPKVDRKARLSHNQKYFSPSLSFDALRVVAVEDDVQASKLALVVLSAGNGDVLRRIELDANSAALPQFSPDGQRVYYYERTFDGTAIIALELTTGARTVLKEASFEPLGNFRVTAANTLVYGSGRDGVDNVYELEPATGAIRQLTNVRIGAEFPFLADSGDLYYAQAHSTGYQLKRLANAAGGLPGKLNPVAPSVFEKSAAYGPDAAPLLENLPSKVYPSEDISDNLSGIRLHSWSAIADANNPGIGIEASNALNTIEIEASGRYNWNEERIQGGATVNYGGFYPVISAGLLYANRNFSTTQPTDTALLVRVRQFDQIATSLTASLPYNWTAGEYSYGFIPSAGASVIRPGSEAATEGLPGSFISSETRLIGQVLKRRARQQVQSRLGATVVVDFRKTIGGEDLGQLFRLDTRLWLPGVGRTHGIRLDFDFQSEDTQRPYQYVDAFQYSRGYDIGFADRAYRFSANYELPLWHPDIGVIGAYYLQRIRLNAFYDYGKYDLVLLEQQTMASTGVELYFDQVFLNTFPLSFGIRWARILEDDIFRNSAGSTQFDFSIGQRF